MATKKHTTVQELSTTLGNEDPDRMKELLRIAVQDVLEAAMNECLGAGPSRRTGTRTGYRAGYYDRNLTTRFGTIELRVPRDREGRFSTELFERYQRSEKALVLALAEMYIQGVSTRKVAAITEQLLGEHISASTISACTKKLDQQLTRWATRPLTEQYPYLFLDARYEKVRTDGVVSSQALLVAIGIDTTGHRSLLAVEAAERESTETWTAFLTGLTDRGLTGVQLTISDDHPGLVKAIQTIIGGKWQRCSVHFMRNVLTHAPKTLDTACLRGLKLVYDAPSLTHARSQLTAWIASWHDRYPSLVRYVEDHIEETLTFHAFPAQHRTHVRSTNVLERLNEELKRRTQVARIFPNTASLLRLTRGLASELDEAWMDAQPYLTMDLLTQPQQSPVTQVA